MLRKLGHIDRKKILRFAYAIQNFGERPIGKQPLCRPEIRREDNIKVAIMKTGYDDMW
jgi:hypothetical protein